jgi:hypothetical protein
MGPCKSGSKDLKSDDAKQKLRDNMGQSKRDSKERDFKEQKRKL